MYNVVIYDGTDAYVKDGEECMRIETKSNSYLIYLHR